MCVFECDSDYDENPVTHQCEKKVMGDNMASIVVVTVAAVLAPASAIIGVTFLVSKFFFTANTIASSVGQAQVVTQIPSVSADGITNIQNSVSMELPNP